MKRRICVIDGRGGGLGRQLVAGLRTHVGDRHHIIGLATNTAAAEAMKEAGANAIGIGGAAIAETVPTADVILASLNLVLPGAMLGEVTPDIVRAILGARATKVLLPVNRSRVEIVGAEARTLDHLIMHSVLRVRSLLSLA